MIFDAKTVLILGAGASEPYGFPLGKRLKDTIIRETSDEASETVTRRRYLEAGFSPEQVAEFHTDLVRSIHPTIDAFLEDRLSRREIGSFGIAAVLKTLEDESALFPQRDWYPRLFRELNLKDFETDSVISAIITFNYDRSLEHYLTETTKRSYEGEAQERALQKLERLNVIHVHGQLGDYPAVPYRPEGSTEKLREAAQGIRMIHDSDIDESDGLRRVRTALAEAREVIFLGFGYDARSLKRLDLSNHVPNRTVFGTAFQLSPTDRGNTEALFGNQRIKLGPDGNPIVDYFDVFYEIKARDRQREQPGLSPA